MSRSRRAAACWRRSPRAARCSRRCWRTRSRCRRAAAAPLVCSRARATRCCMWQQLRLRHGGPFCGRAWAAARRRRSPRSSLRSSPASWPRFSAAQQSSRRRWKLPRSCAPRRSRSQRPRCRGSRRSCRRSCRVPTRVNRHTRTRWTRRERPLAASLGHASMTMCTTTPTGPCARSRRSLRRRRASAATPSCSVQSRRWRARGRSGPRAWTQWHPHGRCIRWMRPRLQCLRQWSRPQC
mmetsp:Transcript_15548/g.32364  ORF Transcript_15548/g.32364 Transcript_15548/m.32364 type:complete len:238 (+) Transcript_15548:1449-2162(+)